MRSRDRTIPIADDDRARIPFAMIGALILVSSVALVVSLELQRDATVDVDDSLAMERSTSAANTALFDATVTATHDAALEPVTEPADTPLGDAISAGGTYTGDDFFERYLKLRIYLEAKENFASSGQEFREMETSVAIDPVEDVDDVEAAIDAVSLTVGGEDADETLTEFDYGDERDTDLGHGTIEVEIDGVETVVERDGEVVAERTQPVSATVGTPIFDLHHRTSEYEAQLEYDFADAQAADEFVGFDQYFAAMLYPLAWERGYAQSEGEPIADVVTNRHVETLANDALYQTQRAVFGADDPHSERLLTIAYACMLAQDATHVYETPDGNGSDVHHVLDHLDDDGFCDDVGEGNDAFDEPFDDPPDWAALASQNEYLEQTETIGLDDVSSTVFGELEDGDGIERAIDRIYTVDLEADAEIERTVFPSDLDAESNSELKAFDVEVLDRTRLVDADETGPERELTEYDVRFEGIFERGSGEDIDDAVVVYDVTLTVSGEHSPNQRVDQRGVDYDYESGVAGSSATIFDTNYHDTPSLATEAVLAGVDDAAAVERQLEGYFEDRHDEIVAADEILDGEDFVDVLTGHEDNWTIHPEPNDREQLRGWLVRELATLEAQTSALEIEPDHRELLQPNSVLDDLAAQLESDEEWVYQHVDGRYTNVPDVVRTEVYLEYVEGLRTTVDAASDRHEAILAEFDDELDDHMNSGIDDAIEFAADQFDESAPEPDTAQRPDYPLLDGIEFVPQGTPAALTVDRIEQERVPAAGDLEDGFVPLAVSNDDSYGIPFEDATADGVELYVAGGVLEAGYLTDDLVDDPNWDDGTVDDLEAALRDWIDRYTVEAAAYGAKPFDGLEQAELAAALDDEIDDLGTVDRQAIRLGEGEDTLDEIAQNVSEEFDVPEESAYDYHLPPFRVHLEHALRHGLDASLGDDGVVSSAEVTASTAPLGDAIRTELDAVDDDVRAERLERTAANESLSLDRGALEAAWLDSDLEGDELAPNRVPAGTDVIDVPMWNVLTANLWHVDIAGEYARVTTKATTGTTTPEQPMEYVRDETTAALEIGETEMDVGDVEPISFESQVSVPVAVPADSFGVGDRAGDRLECSETYDTVGEIPDDAEFAACAES
ncbi:DUF7286 family protein [Natronolimnohabitans innermongolicus]|nr:hypothetical protein [Natronolimnohabitans innermongolicus]